MERADKLAESYEVGNNCADFYNYIIESLINGQRQQVKDLFNEMAPVDQRIFLNQFLTCGDPHQDKVKSLCISELVKREIK